MMIQNPILRGFYPDPSICRVDDDFYLVTSSFSFFPGVPIFHSKDLMHWKQLGHVLERKEQLHVTYEDISLGIFAPTIRYHDGVFYMITTNMTTHENFFCTATNPAGPWSNPIVIRDAGGIDPSLFFDEDGKVYFTGTSPFGDARFDHQVIVCSEIDIHTGQLVGEMWEIGDGSAKDAYSPEGPHLYKKDGWYYLLIAEGGTEHFHGITISRSKSLQEPFEQFWGNPILTHRHLGKEYPICNVGHGDMVECQDGSWYMVCLASRLIGGYHKLLGRETFLVPVEWEDGWPVVSKGTGKVEWEYPAPTFCKESKEVSETTAMQVADGKAAMDMFLGDPLGMDWNYLGTPYEDFTRVEDHRLFIKLLPRNTVPWEFEGEIFDFFGHMAKTGHTKECIPFVGKRLGEARFKGSVCLTFEPEKGETAGIVLLQNNANQLRFEICSEAQEDGIVTTIARVMSVHYMIVNGKMHYDEREEGKLAIFKAQTYELHICGNANWYDFSITVDGNDVAVANDVDGTHLGSEQAGGFVGAYLGLFASGNGKMAEKEAGFQQFRIEY